MFVVTVAKYHHSVIERAISPMSVFGWQWANFACSNDAQATINVLPVDVIVLESTFCGEHFIRSIRQTHPTIPVISVVDDPFMETFYQLRAFERHTTLSLSEVEARLPEVIQQAADSNLSGETFMTCPAPHRRFSFELDNDKSKISKIVELLLDACESQEICNAASRFRLAVALEEALVNAIVHGNLEVSSKLRELGDDSYEKLIAQRQQDPEFSRRRVHLSCNMAEGEVTFTIRDQGKGFDVSSLPDPTDPESLERPCGRGLLLMRSFMNEVTYNDVGNEVCMVYRVEPEEPKVEKARNGNSKATVSS
ncbi:MAG: ATP-binding protein [Planctomycetaceae bacterium]